MKNIKRAVIFFFLIFNFTSGNCQVRIQEGVITKVEILSDFQEDSTLIRTIRTGLSKDSVVNIVFILPVEKQKVQYTYGVGIEEAKKLIDLNLINNNVIFIQPEFCRTPWYGNHPTNPQIGQLNYLNDVIKNITSGYQEYNLKTYLLGFSKSGWGSMSLILNPQNNIDGIFIWDAPLMTKYNPDWDMDEVFENEKYFNESYYLPSKLTENHDIPKSKFIVLGGYDLFRNQSIEFIEKMKLYGVNFIHLDTLNYHHEWNKDWIYSLLKYQPDIIRKIETPSRCRFCRNWRKHASRI